ncbi:putative protease S8 tripeptidyl peptidase I [Talaromyces proteolyticus]|uniref:tripeptidyl-peptidase II n=1 Tax=Talaromyces proteolyticus TaxID=1131652 RepID=A0AAD4KR55_9EURO|nr:putative protease S8 tripeptidyl peptidase I [Talaromyces proteolyticus]KAH8696422.1 putative protease S8 tripeptidyl peptidase I [Talaromyces proteolyticus]
MVSSLLMQLALSVAFNAFSTVAAPTTYEPKEGFDAVPTGWEQISAASATDVLSLRLSMAPADEANLFDLILNLATPGHASYGQFLSADQLKDLVAPSSAASDAVTSWLKEQNLDPDAIQNHGSYLSFAIPVEQAEKMLQTKFYNFKSTATGEVRTLTLKYSVPKSIANYIETIQPTTDFIEIDGPLLQTYGTVDISNNSASAEAGVPIESCNQQVTPACLQSLYGLPSKGLNPTPNQGLAVPGFLNEYASYDDLNLFLLNLRPDLNPRPSFEFASVDGGINTQSQPGVEANLDIQYTVGLANGLQTTFISVGLSNLQGFTDVFNYILQLQNPPPVLSISYGFNENALSRGAATSMCNLLAQLGARGVSVIVASGDGGVAGSRPSDSCNAFVPTFPASCPYVTAVGASTAIPEVGATLSAGGFSNFFGRPLYQDAAVSRYLNTLGSQYSGRFNPNGRAYPDVSAQGENIVIVLQGQGTLVDGTSASAPIFASTIALLNAERSPLPPLGFLNPWLYVQSGVLNDVVSGSNPGCSTNGFPATRGWDPVTGLGTPNYQNMQGLI